MIPHFFSSFFSLPFYGWWHLGALVRRLTLRTYLFFQIKMWLADQWALLLLAGLHPLAMRL